MLTDEKLAEIRSRCPDAIVLDVGDAEIVVKPFDAKSFDTWLNDGTRSQEDADSNVVVRHLLWPSFAELSDLRRRFPLLDGEIVEGLAVDAGKPPRGRVATFDDLTEETPGPVLERAGVSAEEAATYLEQARTQGRRAVVVYAPGEDDEEPFGCILASPRPQDIAPLQATGPDAKKKRAEAVRTAAAGCVLWTRGGTPAEVLRRRPAVVGMVLAGRILEMAGVGALRSQKSRR